MDDQEAPPAVHEGGDGTSCAAPAPGEKKKVPEAEPEVVVKSTGRSAKLTTAPTPPPSTEKNNVPAAATTTAPFAATAGATAATYPSDSDPENVGMPIEGDDGEMDATPPSSVPAAPPSPPQSSALSIMRREHMVEGEGEEGEDEESPLSESVVSGTTASASASGPSGPDEADSATAPHPPAVGPPLPSPG